MKLIKMQSIYIITLQPVKYDLFVHATMKLIEHDLGSNQNIYKPLIYSSPPQDGDELLANYK